MIDEHDLPLELSPFDAVEAAYPAELASAAESLGRRLPVLVECDKELVPFFYKCLRDTLKTRGLGCIYLDGRPKTEQESARGGGLVATMIQQLRDAVRGPVGERVVVLPHLDLLTASSGGGLSAEAREVIPLLYENPNILWLGFRDPSSKPRAKLATCPDPDNFSLERWAAARGGTPGSLSPEGVSGCAHPASGAAHSSAATDSARAAPLRTRSMAQ